MKVFPLSVGGKIALVLIAGMLGIIYSMLSHPEWWMKKLRDRAQKMAESKSKK